MDRIDYWLGRPNFILAMECHSLVLSVAFGLQITLPFLAIQSIYIVRNASDFITQLQAETSPASLTSL